MWGERARVQRPWVIAIAAMTWLATMCAPRPARAQYLPTFSNTGGGIILIIIGVGAGLGDVALGYAVGQGDACSPGLGHDNGKCALEVSGTALVGAASAALVGGGIALIVIDQRSPRRAARPGALLALDLPSLPPLELRPTAHGLLLRGAF
jgi:hypothetical protein